MIIHGVQCPACLDVLFSRARHDFRYCFCHKTFVDGGFDYLRTTSEATAVNINIGGVTGATLYKDWNKSINKFGHYAALAKYPANITLNLSGIKLTLFDFDEASHTNEQAAICADRLAEFARKWAVVIGGDLQIIEDDLAVIKKVLTGT